MIVSELGVCNSALSPGCAGPAKAGLWPAALCCLGRCLPLAQWVQPELLKACKIRIPPSVSGKAEPDLSTELLFSHTRMKSKIYFFN